jgi:hypothetical protein
MSNLSDIPELSNTERLSLAHYAFVEVGGKGGELSIHKASRIYRVSYSTLRDRINRAFPKAEFQQSRQRLTHGEEEAIAEWILLLANWSWPVRIDQLRKMALELLYTKGDNNELSLRWHDSFLDRHLLCWE